MTEQGISNYIRRRAGGRRAVFSLMLVFLLIRSVAAIGQGTPRAVPVSGDAGKGNKWAVVVGVDYSAKGSTLTRLNYTTGDARLFLDALGIDRSRATLLVSGSGEQPTFRNVWDAIEQTARKAGPDDVFFFYFAGHGRESGGKSFLAPDDARFEDLGTFISVSKVRDFLSDRAKCRARAKVIVLDACHSGSARGEPKAFETAFTGANGLVTIAACQLNQVSWEFHDLQHGVFTYYFAQGLAGAGADERQNLVFLSQLRDYVTRMVLQRTKDSNPPQSPVFVLPAGFVDFPVARRNSQVLAKIVTHTGGELVAREPLRPGVFVLATTQGGKIDEFFQGRLQSELVQLGYPVVSRDTSSQFIRLLSDPKDTAQAVAAAKRMEARFLLRFTSELSTPRFDPSIGRYFVNCAVTAEVVDVYGNVKGTAAPDADQHPNAGSGGTIVAAQERARQRAIENILPALDEDLEQLVKRRKAADPPAVP